MFRAKPGKLGNEGHQNRQKRPVEDLSCRTKTVIEELERRMHIQDAIQIDGFALMRDHRQQQTAKERDTDGCYPDGQAESRKGFHWGRSIAGISNCSILACHVWAARNAAWPLRAIARRASLLFK